MPKEGSYSEVRRDSGGNEVGRTVVSDSGSTRAYNSNPSGHYTVHGDGSAWKTGSDGKASQVSNSDSGGSGGSGGSGK